MRDLLPSSVDVTWGILLAVPVFILIFCVLVWWVYKKDRKTIYKEVSELPLKED